MFLISRMTLALLLVLRGACALAKSDDEGRWLALAPSAVEKGDTDGDHMLSATEFSQKMRGDGKLQQEVFRALDLDRDGLLDSEPFEQDSTNVDANRGGSAGASLGGSLGVQLERREWGRWFRRKRTEADKKKADSTKPPLSDSLSPAQIEEQDYQKKIGAWCDARMDAIDEEKNKGEDSALKVLTLEEPKGPLGLAIANEVGIVLSIDEGSHADGDFQVGDSIIRVNGEETRKGDQDTREGVVMANVALHAAVDSGEALTIVVERLPKQDVMMFQEFVADVEQSEGVIPEANVDNAVLSEEQLSEMVATIIGNKEDLLKRERAQHHWGVLRATVQAEHRLVKLGAKYHKRKFYSKAWHNAGHRMVGSWKRKDMKGKVYFVFKAMATGTVIALTLAHFPVATLFIAAGVTAGVLATAEAYMVARKAKKEGGASRLLSPPLPSSPLLSPPLPSSPALAIAHASRHKLFPRPPRSTGLHSASSLLRSPTRALALRQVRAPRRRWERRWAPSCSAWCTTAS